MLLKKRVPVRFLRKRKPRSLLKKVLIRNARRKQKRYTRNRHPLKKHLPFLRRLVTVSQKGGGKLVHFLKKAKSPQIKSINRTFYNLLRGNIDIPEDARLYLKQHRGIVRKLASKRGTTKSNRNLLIKQAGGFLPGLIGALIPTLISTISSLAR